MEFCFLRFLFGLHFWANVFIIFLTSKLADCVLFSEDSSIMDVTPMTLVVVTGTTARLPCSVDPKYTEQYADQFKVMWVSPRETPISMQDRRIINDQRISIERPLLKDWDLFIRNVSLTDAGTYKCQVNTDPVRTKEITLKVKAPPRIIDHSAPLVVEKPEGEKVELFCNATGSPMPNITWYRLHRNDNGVRERVGNIGESLVIHNITRVCGDTYECVADNGVAPAMTQAFKVTVLYAPEVNLPNSRLSQKARGETILECEVFASPLGVAVWKKNGRTLGKTKNHELTLYNTDPTEGIVLNLRIRTVTEADFGIYECEASNALGTVSETMELSELKTTTTSTTTTTTTTRRQQWIYNNNDKDIIDVKSGGRDKDSHSIWDPYNTRGETYGRKSDGSSAGQSSHTGSNPNAGGSRSDVNDGNSAPRLVPFQPSTLVFVSSPFIFMVLFNVLVSFSMR